MSSLLSDEDFNTLKGEAIETVILALKHCSAIYDFQGKPKMNFFLMIWLNFVMGKESHMLA